MATSELYPEFWNALFDGATAADLDNLVCTLHDDTNGFDETHSVWSDVSGSEIGDTDYASQSLTGITITTNQASLPWTVDVDCDDITFGTSVNISAYHAIIRDADTDQLLFHVDFGGLKESVDGEFTLQIDSNGLLAEEVKSA